MIILSDRSGSFSKSAIHHLPPSLRQQPVDTSSTSRPSLASSPTSEYPINSQHNGRSHYVETKNAPSFVHVRAITKCIAQLILSQSRPISSAALSTASAGLAAAIPATQKRTWHRLANGGDYGCRDRSSPSNLAYNSSLAHSNRQKENRQDRAVNHALPHS